MIRFVLNIETAIVHWIQCKRWNSGNNSRIWLIDRGHLQPFARFHSTTRIQKQDPFVTKRVQAWETFDYFLAFNYIGYNRKSISRINALSGTQKKLPHTIECPPNATRIESLSTLAKLVDNTDWYHIHSSTTRTRLMRERVTHSHTNGSAAPQRNDRGLKYIYSRFFVAEPTLLDAKTPLRMNVDTPAFTKKNERNFQLRKCRPLLYFPLARSVIRAQLNTNWLLSELNHETFPPWYHDIQIDKGLNGMMMWRFQSY